MPVVVKAIIIGKQFVLVKHATYKNAAENSGVSDMRSLIDFIVVEFQDEVPTCMIIKARARPILSK